MTRAGVGEEVPDVLGLSDAIVCESVGVYSGVCVQR